jgi:RNA polymerase sigma-70 factor, ECF subfamily
VATEAGDRQPTDSELVRKARGGDPKAFHEIVDRYARFLFGLAASLCGNSADAEDLVQETLAGAFRGLGAFEERSSLKTWLARILVRQNARRHRSGARREAVTVPLNEATEAEAGHAGPHAAMEARMDVAGALGALGNEHREVIVLREIEGLSYEEIAEVLDVPRGTVESRLFRARRALRDLLQGYFE